MSLSLSYWYPGSGMVLDCINFLSLHRYLLLLYFRLARQCVTDCEINGVQFKKNMSVRYMLCTLYNDEKYFPEPEKFIPER